MEILRAIIHKCASLTVLILLFAINATAGTIENFNSRKGVSLASIKSTLQGGCWSFHHFDINNKDWDPALDGDGAMVSSADASSFPNSGIYTPVLDVTSNITLSFQYTFNENFIASVTRWINICLAKEDNEIVRVLEHVDLNGSNATRKKTYNTQFTNIPIGEYRIVLQYGGSGGTSRIAIDAIDISAPFKYPGGCNSAPVAVKDKITGMPDRTAHGSLLQNDKDADHEQLSAYLIKGSDNGQVELHEDGTFIFIPDKDFTGSSTSFIYKICDNGATALCSANTTVFINFPTAGTGSLRLSDFKGSYKNNGVVELAWKTKGVPAQEKFVVERSLNGQSWENSGVVPALQISNGHDYAYLDKLSKNTVQKNDVYYRLRQVNADGTNESTSRLLIVRVYSNKLLTMISVTPNPAKNDISVNVQLQEDGHVSMRLMNNMGAPILFKSEGAQKGLNTLILEGSSQIAPGAYTLEVIVNSRERMIVKLIKE